jgi:helix-turn-helix protein
MARLAATLPGYASVTRASEVLHLAPRSVRDLIYAGRIPSLRIGRLHYIRAADLEQERRRRLGLPLRRGVQRSSSERPRRSRAPRSTTPPNHSLDAALRRQRAAERAELVSRWAQHHGVAAPRIPAHVLSVTTPVTCEVCGRVVRHGRYVGLTPESGQVAQLCVTCGRRALLEWADRRRQEAAAARQMAQSLGEPEGSNVSARPAELLQQVLAGCEGEPEKSAPTNPRAA